jgi:MurNAc alpha-1-phosphate uridylyltransferase
MRAMILAAGRGERMRPFTDTVPKPLLEVAGKPLIVYQIEKLAAAGVRDIIVNLAWKGSMIRAALGDGRAWGVSILYSDEGEHALETGGGIFKALPLLGTDPFLVISGDIWTQWQITAATRLGGNDLAHLVMVPNPDYHQGGDFGLRGQRIDDLPGERLTFGNVALYRPELFAGCEAGYFKLHPVLRRAIEAGRVSGESYQGPWRNVGTPAELAQLDGELSRSGS